MKIVFCDIDGVLVNSKSWYVRSGLQATADPLCVAALNRIIAETGAKIVVSSTWRYNTPNAELRDLFKRWGVEGVVVGKTPDLRGKVGSIHTAPCRGDEIGEWLLTHGERHDVNQFAILDDDADMGILDPMLVKTEFTVGLTMRDAERAIRILRDSLPDRAMPGHLEGHRRES